MTLHRTRIVALVLFLTANAVKATPSLEDLPFDLTIFGATFVIVLIAATILLRPSLPRPLAWVPLLFVPLAFGAFTSSMNEYSVDKMLRLYTLTLLAAVAPHFLVKVSDDVRRLCFGLFAMSVILAAFATFGVDGTSAGNRLTSGTNPILFARIMGAGLIWLFLAWMQTGKKRLLLFFVPLAFSLIASGSRGPMLFAAVALAVTLWSLPFAKLRYATRFALVAVVAGIGVTHAVDHIPYEALLRLQMLTSQDMGHSISDRFVAYTRTADLVSTTPLGIGWGDFGRTIGVWGTGDDQYPHNLILEVALEAGWIPALILVLCLAAAHVRAFRVAKLGHEGRLLFAMLVFYTLNAMVSSDINGQREMFAFMAIAVGLKYPHDLVQRLPVGRRRTPDRTVQDAAIHSEQHCLPRSSRNTG